MFGHRSVRSYLRTILDIAQDGALTIKRIDVNLRSLMSTQPTLTDEVAQLKAAVNANTAAAAALTQAVTDEISRVNDVITSLQAQLQGGSINSTDLSNALAVITDSLGNLNNTNKQLQDLTGTLAAEQPVAPPAEPPAPTA